MLRLQLLVCRGIPNSASQSCTIYYADDAVILIEQSTSVYVNLYVTLVSQTEPMSKEPRSSPIGR